MSERINIENSLYEFDFVIFSDDGKNAVQLNKSSVRYLEIEDNLANIGMVGKIIISNYNGLLQKLNAYNVNTESPNIAIRFKNLDFKAAGTKIIPEVHLLAALGKSTEMSSNVIDRHVAFEFEEKSIVKLKRFYINNPGEVLTLNQNTEAKPELTISQIFKAYCPEIMQNAEDIKASSSEPLAVTVLKQGDSAYDIITKAYDHLAYDPADGEIKSPGLVQVENVEGKLERKLVIKSLAEDITEFFKIVQKKGDASKYLNDKFTVAFSNKGDVVLRDNVITKYDIMRVNYEEVFERKWSNVYKVSGDIDGSFTQYYKYSELRTAFENLFTNPYACNLPNRDDNTIKILEYSYPGAVSNVVTTAWATNKILKSFIYDNVAVVFKVKGQPYRVPGKFIRINMDNPTGANKSTSKYTASCASTSTDESADSDILNGWWYVISVQHVFENDIYFNKITAVKIYLPVALQAPTSYGLINDGGGILGSTGGTNKRSDSDYNIDESGNVEFIEPPSSTGESEGLLPPLQGDPEGYIPKPGVDDFIFGPPNKEDLTPPSNQVNEPGIFRDNTPQGPIT